jgi:hypothetical protein
VSKTPTAKVSLRVLILVTWQEFMEASRGSRVTSTFRAPSGKASIGRSAAYTEPGGGPDRKRYVITDQGVTEVVAWLTEAVRRSRTYSRCCSSRSYLR